MCRCLAVFDSNKEKNQHLLDLGASSNGTVKLFEADLLKKGSFEEAMKQDPAAYQVYSEMLGSPELSPSFVPGAAQHTELSCFS